VAKKWQKSGKMEFVLIKRPKMATFRAASGA